MCQRCPGTSNHHDPDWYQKSKRAKADAARYQKKKALKAAEAAEAACGDCEEAHEAEAPRTPFTQRAAAPATAELYENFRWRSDGKQRNDAAAERAGQRAVKKINDALPWDDSQAAAALKHAMLKGRIGEVAASAGVVDSFATDVLGRIKAAIEAMRIRPGGLSADVEAALSTFLTMAAPEPQEHVLQRGRQAKKQRAEGGAVQPAAVVNVRAWADALGLTISTAWRRLKAAIERRAKLDEGAEELLWVYYRERIGRGISSEIKRLVYDFYIAHPGIKRSPIAGDVLRIPDDDGERRPVAKLLSEVSLTDVYLDFEEKHPGLIKERSFRNLRPPELRRMSRRHLDMCGCRYCVEMRLFQDVLNKERRRLALSSAGYTPPYALDRHAKPSGAAQDVVCGDATDADGKSLGHPKLRCLLGWCPTCGVNKMSTCDEEEKGTQPITYQYYDTVEAPNSYGGTSKHMKLLKKTIPMSEFMPKYREKLAFFTYHRGMVRLNTLMRIERMGFSKGDASLIMDFSEKLNKERRTQVQTQHWETTAMTIEVAVAEAWDPDLTADEVAQIAARLLAAKGDERGKVLDEWRALRKLVYYHCSDYKPQVAAVSSHNMHVMLKEMLDREQIAEKGTVWLKMDGCAKQYKCGKAMYLMCGLAKELKLTLDQMNEVTGHGKDEADGHGGVFKNWLLRKMHGSELSDGEIEAADVIEGETASFAAKMCEVARAGIAELKPSAMNSKRTERSNLAKRYYKTYIEGNITMPPEIVPLTVALSKDAPANADPRTKAMLAHHNFRADPELQKPNKHRVIAVRRLACACAGCRARLALPVAQRYRQHDECERSGIFGRLNDWKLCELQPTTDDAQAQMEEDDDLQLQEHTDAIVAATAPGDNLAMRGKDKKHAPEGYYILVACSAPYVLDADTTIDELLDDEGKPVQCSKGETVVAARYRNLVDPKATANISATRKKERWFTPYPHDDPNGDVRVPTKMILMSGFDMPLASEPRVTDEDYEKAWRSEKGPKSDPKKYKWGPRYQRKEAERKAATILPDETHSAIMDELDERGEA